MFLLRRNNDILRILLQPNKRTRFQIIIASVLNKILDQLTGSRKLLHFIKYYQRISLIKDRGIKRCKLGEEQIKIRTVIHKEIKNILRGVTEINNDMASVFLLCKELGNVALADTPRTVYQKRSLAVASTLPIYKFIIDFPL